MICPLKPLKKINSSLNHPPFSSWVVSWTSCAAPSPIARSKHAATL